MCWMLDVDYSRLMCWMLSKLTQQSLTCPKSTIETLEKGEKYLQS